MVARRRGGYCFEHNLLLAGALESLGGREVDPILARVRLGPEGAPRPLNHLLLRVRERDGSLWLADVGFGGGGLLDPVPFEVPRESEQSGWRYRLREDGPELVLQVHQDDDWSDMYGFVPEPAPRRRHRSQQLVHRDPPGILLRHERHGGFAEPRSVLDPVRQRQCRADRAPRGLRIERDRTSSQRSTRPSFLAFRHPERGAHRKRDTAYAARQRPPRIAASQRSSVTCAGSAKRRECVQGAHRTRWTAAHPPAAR